MTRARGTSEVIGFRATEDLLRLIDAAREPFGISRGDWVRGVVMARLDDHEREELGCRLEELHAVTLQADSALERLHQNVARSLFVVLTRVAHLQDAEAKSIVRSTLLS